MTKPAAFLLLLMLLPAAAKAACPAGERALLTARLYFGQGMDKGMVPGAAWRDFVARAVTPRFPDGFTVYDAEGQWRDARRQVRHEKTKVIEIAAPDTRDFHLRIAALRRDYAARFHQQAVGLLTMPSCGTF